MNVMKKAYYGVSIRKKIIFGFLYVGTLSLIIVMIGMIGFINVDRKMNDFYKGPYKIEENVLNAQISLLRIENYTNKAYMSRQSDTLQKYIGMAEEEHLKLEGYITVIDENIEVIKKESEEEIISNLKTEVEKGARYRRRIAENGAKEDRDAIITTYVNDYAPILDHISKELSKISIVSSNYAKDFIKEANTSTIINLFLFFIIIIFGMIGSLYIIKFVVSSINTPINTMKDIMYQISQGNLNVRLEYNSGDEIGELCEAIRDTIAELKNYIEHIILVLNAIVKKDMTVHIETEFLGDFAPIKEAFQKITVSLNEMLYQVKDTGTQIQEGASHISLSANEVSEGALSQAESIAFLTKQLENVMIQVQENTKQAQYVNQISIEMEEKATEGKTFLHNLVNAMNSVSTHTERIWDVIRLIEEMAEQTHLLSLNASIEAARVGEQGRGFAVIASEISKLANQSSYATKSTSELVSNSVSTIKEAVTVVTETEVKFLGILNSTIDTKKVMETIYDTSMKEKVLLEELAAHAQNLLTVVNQNSEYAKESLATSEEFVSQADLLREMLEDFTLLEQFSERYM